MPQRPFRSQSSGPIDKGGEDRPTLTESDERALARIGYDKGPSNELEWFVRLASTDWDKSSEGDLLNLREEFVALQKVRLRVHTELPDTDSVAEVQQIAKRHLTELADNGVTRFPEIPVSQYIEYPRARERRWINQGHSPSALSNDTPDCISLYHAAHGIGLIVVLGHLLATVQNVIARCPHCKRIFLQSRRNQEYCSRSCQSTAVMKRHRAEERARKQGKRTNKRPGGQHGSKGR